MDKQLIAHELWAAAQLVPGEGIEDGAQRIAVILERIDAERGKEAVAWWDGQYNDPRFSLTGNSFGVDERPLFLSAPTIPEGMAMVQIVQLEHAGRQAKMAADYIVEFSKAKPGGMCGYLDDACTAADIAASDICTMLAAAQGERNE